MTAPLRERIHAAAKPYLAGTWRYGRTPRVEWPWPRGIRGPAMAGAPIDREIDCSTLTASVLMRCYPDAPWTPQDYADLQVFDARRLDSPIAAVVRAGVGVAAEHPTAETWTLVQAWRSVQPPSGHAFLVYDRGDLRSGTVDVLESTSRGLLGPRWRTTTWAALRAAYPAALYLARLRDP